MALVVTATWWYVRSDERRVSAACGTYLEHRELLRGALTETNEAVERAVAAKAEVTEDEYFNDADEVRAWIDQWLRQSPGVIDSLDRDQDAGRLDRGAVASLMAVEEGLVELQTLVEGSAPSDVADWLPEVAARMQGVDDTCLSAARSAWL